MTQGTRSSTQQDPPGDPTPSALQFMGRWLRTAFTHEWKRSQLAGSVAAATVAAAAWAAAEWPTIADIGSRLAWQIPLASLVLLAALRAVLAPLWLIRAAYEEKAEVEAERDEFGRQLATERRELEREFRSAHEEYRDAAAAFSRLVQTAYKSFVGSQHSWAASDKSWRGELTRSGMMLNFARRVTEDNCGGLLGGQLREPEPDDFDRLRRDVKQFFDYCNRFRLQDPVFYEEIVEPELRPFQENMLNLLVYLEPALANRLHGVRYPGKRIPNWKQLWDSWE